MPAKRRHGISVWAPGACAAVGTLMCGIVVAANDQVHSDRPERIFERTIKAYGGISHIKDFNKKLKIYSGTEQVDAYPPHACMQMRAGDLFRTERKMPNYSESSGYDGHLYWSSNRGLVVTRTPAQATVDEFYRQHSITSALLSWHTGVKLSPLPNLKVDGRACSGFSVPVPGSTPVDLWTYNDTGLVARVHYFAPNPAGAERRDDIVSEFSDYHHIQGIDVPFRILTVREGQKIHAKWQDVKLSDASAQVNFSPPTDPNRLAKAITCQFDEKSRYLAFDGLIQHSKAKIILDTGATISVVNSIFAKTINATPEKVDQTKLKGMFSEVSAGFSNLSLLQIGDLQLTDVPVMVRVGDKPWFAAALGMDVIGRHAMAIDFARHTVTFLPKAPIAESDAIVLPMRAAGRPSIQVKINGGKAESFLVDTGAPDNVIQKAGTIKFLNLSTEQTNDKIMDAHFVMHKAITVQLHSIQVGSLKLTKQMVFCVPDAKPGADNILGLAFMKQFSQVIFDFPNNRLLLVPKKS